MRIESKLCHLSDNKAVVLVNGWLNDENVGSALAEAATVELAEDKAISRLNKRLSINFDTEDNVKIINEDKIKNKANLNLSKSEDLATIERNKEPSDWSNELTAIESEISRLNWSRNDEMRFLENNLGYKSRNQITKYRDLVKYLSILKNVDNFNSSTLNTKNIKSLIDESDIILEDLSWDYKQGREYLMTEFNVSTRKELNLQQLLSFVDKLRAIRDKNFTQ